MNEKVEVLWKRLQGDLAKLLADLDKVKVGLLEASPGKEKWSVTQVMYHLNTAESFSGRYIVKKKLGSAQLKPTTFEAEIRLLFAKIAFYLPLKYQAPKLLGTMPEHVAYEEIKNTWLQTRNELAEILNSLSDSELYKPIFKQPFFGRWNIFQMLGFMQTHFNRHRKQMLRIVEKPEKA